MRLSGSIVKIALLLLIVVLAACSPETVVVTRIVFEEPETVAQQVEVTRVVTEEVEVVGEVVEVTRIVTNSETESYTEGQQLNTPAPLPTSPPLYMEVTATPVPEAPVQNFEVNPFIPTSVDHLSTFSLDVDTGAYTLARRYIRNGNLPRASTVRVEEFVNYFDQEYPIPADSAFAVYADGAPSPFHHDGTYLVRIGVQGHEIAEQERPDVNLAFVIDTSGSMSGQNRLETVKDALNMLVDQMRPQDQVSIVIYAGGASVMLDPTSGAHKAEIMRAIDSLHPGGSTNLEAGLLLGYNMANQAYIPGGVNRVVLASDGVANVGLTDPDGLARQIRGFADAGITLTTIGVGMGDYNDHLMEQLADQGDGNYAYVDTLQEAHRVFTQDLVATLHVIALDAKVQVDFNPEVVAQYRLIGYENRAIADADFRNDAVDAAEFGSGHTATAIYAVQFYPGADGRVATVQLRWEDPENHQVHEINGNFNTWDLASSFDQTSPRFQLAVVAAQFAEMLRNSAWVGDSSYARLNAYAQRLAGQLAYDEEVNDFASLVATVDQWLP